MTDEVKKVFHEIEQLFPEPQQELVQLIQDELNWDEAFVQSQNELSKLASEALKEYKLGNTSQKDWP